MKVNIHFAVLIHTLATNRSIATSNTPPNWVAAVGVSIKFIIDNNLTGLIHLSGGFRNSERGVYAATGVQSTPKNFGVAMPTFGHGKVRIEYLKATL